LKRAKESEKEVHKRANKDFASKLRFLSKVPLFSQLPKDKDPILAKAIEDVSFEPDEFIIRQGEIGTELFVITDGEAVMLSAEGAPLATLVQGDYCGGRALIIDEPHVTSVKASTPLSCMKLTREGIQELDIGKYVDFTARRPAVIETYTVCAKEPSPKTAEERALIEQALRRNETLNTLVSLTDDRVSDIVDRMWKEEIVTCEDDCFCVVLQGRFKGVGVNVEERVVGPGESFGENALFYSTTSVVSFSSEGGATVFVLDRKSFKEILKKQSDAKVEEYTRCLEKVDILASLLAQDREELAQALRELYFTKDEVVLRQGEIGNNFYILYDGAVSINKDGEQRNILTSQAGAKGPVRYFGERALLKDEPRSATVIVHSKEARILALDRAVFDLMLGPLKDIIDRKRKRTSFQAGMVKTMTGVRTTSAGPVPQSDLAVVGLLGCGGFGVVSLVQSKRNQKAFALKAISKGYIVQMKMQERIMSEKEVMTMTDSRFIIKLYECYTDDQFLYLLLEPALGGELYATYRRVGMYGSMKHARYYAASVVMALEHLHERYIIYRDLKPENLILSEKGMLKLTDMGLARFCVGKAFSTVGTPEYFAPEIIASSGHNKAVDWWTFGILVFELLAGHTPFVARKSSDICKKVLKGIDDVNFPPVAKGETKELVEALLTKDPSQRLPMRAGGNALLKKHQWFAGFDWDALKAGSLPVPYKPDVRHSKDLSNFCAKQEHAPKPVQYNDDGSGCFDEWATI